MVPEPRGVYQEDENKKNITHSSDKQKLSRQDSLRIREYEFELKLSDLPIKRKESRYNGPGVGINVGQKGSQDAGKHIRPYTLNYRSQELLVF